MSEPFDGSGAIFALLREQDTGARRLSFSDGQVVFQPSEPARDFFLIESGEIRLFEVVSHGSCRLLDILGPERSFGFAGLGKLPTYGKLTLSVGSSEVQAISIARLRELIAGSGELAMRIIESLAHELHQAWTEGSHFVFEDCRLRLIKTLLRFRNSPAARAIPGGVELRITHAQLAQAVGSARETVSLCLMQLRQENLVRTGRNRVFFDPECLRRFDPRPEAASELAIAG